jgi:hypothetical protein
MAIPRAAVFEVHTYLEGVSKSAGWVRTWVAPAEEIVRRAVLLDDDHNVFERRRRLVAELLGNGERRQEGD